MKTVCDLHGCIVGLGSIGNRHLRNLHSVGVGRLSVVRRKKGRNTNFDVPKHVNEWYSLIEILECDCPDFVVICNPTNLHVETAIKCLNFNCDVLIEKPLDSTPNDSVTRLTQVAQKKNRIVAMAYCMRYHPAYHMAYESIRNNLIGRAIYAKAWFEGYLPDWHPWEDYRESYAARRDSGGGVLRTLDHELDFLNWVFGAADVAIGRVFNTTSIGIDADDLAIYLLSHPNSVKSQITTSFCRKPQSRGFEIVGTNGNLTFSLEQGFLRHYCSRLNTSTDVLDTRQFDINEMYRQLIVDFVDAVLSRSITPRIATLDAARDNLSVFEKLDT